MITPEELAELEKVEETETDFYAGLLFLTVVRAARMPATVPTNPMAYYRELVLGVYADLNDRIAQHESESL